MFIDKDSLQIKVGNGAYVKVGQYLLDIKYGYPKLWSHDSGRNLAGKQSGTLIGVFPKIILEFRKLTKDEFELLAPILDAPRQKVKYYDPYKQAYREMDTYTGDYEVTNKNIIDASHRNEGFSISFIAVDRRA